MSQATEVLKYFEAKILLEDGNFHTVCTLQAINMAQAILAFPNIFPEYVGIMTVISEISLDRYEELINDPSRPPAHRCPVCGSACTAVYETGRTVAVCRRCGNESGLKEATP